MVAIFSTQANDITPSVSHSELLDNHLHSVPAMNGTSTENLPEKSGCYLLDVAVVMLKSRPGK